MTDPTPIMTTAQKLRWRRLERALEKASAKPRAALGRFLEKFDCEPQECEACGEVYRLEDCTMGEDGWFCEPCVDQWAEAERRPASASEPRAEGEGTQSP